MLNIKQYSNNNNYIVDWNNICLIAQLLNLTIPSAHLEYNDRFKTGAHQGNETLRRNDSS
jgi:hypothetical protein